MEQTDMQCLSRLPERVREALFGRRTPGKHSRAYVAPPVHAARVSAPAIEPRALDGHALAMARPYPVAYEKRQEQQRHPQRTRALMLTTVGID
ncbi:hypothetical protein KN815_07870, partial [Streptomyces sp. 4503]|nr:hypothetical protein [Streptomyces niphimycinicus]